MKLFVLAAMAAAATPALAFAAQDTTSPAAPMQTMPTPPSTTPMPPTTMTPDSTMSAPATTPMAMPPAPAPQASYPYCSRTVTDQCIERHSLR